MLLSKPLSRICCVIYVIVSGIAFPSITIAAEENPKSDFQVALSVVYSSRSVGATIGVTNPGSLGFIATADSLGLGRADGFQENVELRWKRWAFGVNYVPTSVSGQGTATSGLQIGSGPIIAVGTPMTTTIDVSMLLGTAYYFVVQKSDMELGLGLGFGKTSIDVAFVPALGQPSGYDGNTPFGFLSVRMINRVDRFFYGASVNGIGFSFEGTTIHYFDLNLAAGYRVLDDRVKGDILAGWRYIGFGFAFDVPPTITKTDVQLSGPYIGVRFVF
jgi:hypothetical protein